MKVKINKRQLMFLLSVILLTYWAVRPIFIDGFFPTHDDTAPARIDQMVKAISQGQFPVRWVPDLGYGYGYPLFNFYAPLPYYIGSFFRLSGFSAINSAKLMFAAGIILSGIFMYLLIDAIASEWEALLSAVLFVYAPYHAINIYIRGAVGEYYAYAMLPLLILGIFTLLKQAEKKSGILITSFALFGVLTSHNILGLITTYFVLSALIIFVILLLIRKVRLQLFFTLVFVILLSYGLSAFFTLPAFLEKKYTRTAELTKGGSDYRLHFVIPDQLWDSPWGFAGSAPGRADGMSFKLGKIHLVLGLLGLILLFIKIKMKKTDERKIYYLASVVLIMSLFFMFRESRYFWSILPGFSYIQYPWRFENFTILSLCILASYAIVRLKNSYKLTTVIFLISVVILSSFKYFSPMQYLPLKDEDYTSDANLRYKISKISDEYMPPNFKSVDDPSDTAYNSISQTYESVTVKKYEIGTNGPTTIYTNIAYFPGWQAAIDGNRLDIKEKNGVIVLDIPNGGNQLTIELKNTPVRTTANTISVLSFFLLVYLSFGKKYDKA